LSRVIRCPVKILGVMIVTSFVGGVQLRFFGDVSARKRWEWEERQLVSCEDENQLLVVRKFLKLPLSAMSLNNLVEYKYRKKFYIQIYKIFFGRSALTGIKADTHCRYYHHQS